ncbi:MAG TPA: TolC family protein [Verrucomicrobiae bacterium]|jgi:outer membrane protein|nr:TolC family protein [Verrucomicrobiae bacterium]
MKFIQKISVILVACAVSAGVTAVAATNDFPTLTLVEARQMALKNHPRIAAANYRVLAAQEVTRESRAGFFPQVNLYGSAVGADSVDTRIEAGGLNNPSVFDRAAGGVGVSQLITDFGRTANLTASSRFQAQAEGQNANATREQVLLSVDEDYFSTLQAQSVMNVAQQTLDTRQLLLDQVTVLASNKLKSELDVSFARVALEEGQLLLQRAQNNFEASLASLSTALGFREFRRFNLVEEALPISDGTNDVSALIDTALRDRPEILALTNEREAASRFARAQKDSRLPTVSAIGAAGGSPMHDDRLPDDYAAGGLQVSVPVFAGGLYVARQHEAEFRAEADAELLRALEDNVIRDVRIAWLNLNNARERLRTTEQLVNHANEAFDLEQARYNAGSSSIVELSEAQLELTSAQIAATNARYDVLIQEANVNYQIGGLSAATRPAEPSRKQPKHS